MRYPLLAIDTDLVGYTLLEQLASASPSREGNKFEKPSEHIPDGFSYIGKMLLIEETDFFS